MGEKLTIVGIREVNYTSKKTGKPVVGTEFYYTQHPLQSGVDGLVAGKLFVGANALSGFSFIPSVGDDVFVFYNRFGSVSGFSAA